MSEDWMVPARSRDRFLNTGNSRCREPRQGAVDFGLSFRTKSNDAGECAEEPIVLEWFDEHAADVRQLGDMRDAISRGIAGHDNASDIRM